MISRPTHKSAATVFDDFRQHIDVGADDRDAQCHVFHRNPADHLRAVGGNHPHIQCADQFPVVEAVVAVEEDYSFQDTQLPSQHLQFLPGYIAILAADEKARPGRFFQCLRRSMQEAGVILHRVEPGDHPYQHFFGLDAQLQAQGGRFLQGAVKIRVQRAIDDGAAPFENRPHRLVALVAGFAAEDVEIGAPVVEQPVEAMIARRTHIADGAYQRQGSGGELPEQRAEGMIFRAVCIDQGDPRFPYVTPQRTQVAQGQLRLERFKVDLGKGGQRKNLTGLAQWRAVDPASGDAGNPRPVERIAQADTVIGAGVPPAHRDQLQGFQLRRRHLLFLKCSCSILQNSAPCSIASSSARWAWGRSSNQRRGMARLVERRYSCFSIAMAKVLMSSAEWEKGLSPVNRIRYQ